MALTNKIQNGDLVANSVTTSKVANGTITTSKLADQSVSPLKILGPPAATQGQFIPGLVLASKSTQSSGTAVEWKKLLATELDGSGATNGQVLTYTGTNVEWTTPSGGGSSPSSSFLSAHNISGGLIAVVLGGTPIPLPASQNLNGFVSNGQGTLFTVPATGTYMITMDVRLVSPVLLGCQAVKGGVPIAPLQFQPVTSRDRFHANAIVSLTAGETVGLQFYGVLAAVTLESNGAALTIHRIN
ncbi:MAG: hypothetical protein EOO88_27080 [Pedobacter sp.]|nr:MAG: hypothetical protein EOO88_27080 [Pedobacter sp.]